MKPTRVRLFIKPYCPWCSKAQDWLDARGVDYEVVNVMADDKAYDEMERLSGQTLAPVIENADLCTAAAALLPPEPWDQNTWGQWAAAVKDKTGTKGRTLFHPLRLALTGLENGPELKALLPLIGRERALARLRGETG